jgi:hypothetical protein
LAAAEGFGRLTAGTRDDGRAGLQVCLVEPAEIFAVT